MRLQTTFVPLALAALLLAPLGTAFAAAPDEKDRVLRQLDEAAKNFHSTSADFEFDSITTDPIYDKDVQTGSVYYQRDGSAPKMIAHIEKNNGRPAPKVYGFFDGVFKLYEPIPNQVTILTKFSQYQSWFMLGFGASGKELEDKWEIKYLGPETLMDGKQAVKTEKLELVPKDPGIRKNLPKVTIWVDAVRGINLKQSFDQGPGLHRDCFYFNVKYNQSIPKDAFTLKTDKKTQVIKQ